MRFLGRRAQPRLWNTDEDEVTSRQDMAHDLSDAFTEYDTAALARLTTAQREEQLRARWALHRHVDAIWEDGKRRGLDPAVRA
jgi:hypothetical protein